MMIVDHGDGTWTASELKLNTYVFQSEDDPNIYELRNANAVWVLGEVNEKYVISNVSGEPGKLELRINGDGTWVAISENEIQVLDGVFTLTDVDLVFSGPDMFRIKEQL